MDEPPFYMPDPDLFGHPDAYPLYTGYAAELEKAGLVDRFPRDPDLRKVVIELLAERHAVELVEDDPSLIEDAIAEARHMTERRRD